MRRPLRVEGVILRGEVCLRAVHLVFEVTGVIGGMAAPRSAHADDSIDVYIGCDAGPDDVDVFNAGAARTIRDRSAICCS
jgi:hypothetical protein